jgi:predicted transcriptional regulator
VVINRNQVDIRFGQMAKDTDRHSIEDILKTISDSKSLDLFSSIAQGSGESEILKETKGLSKKQYYLRTRQLLKTGLIKRMKGRFSLTSFGVIVYHAAQLIVEKGMNNYWKLKAIDSIQSSAEIGEHERTKLIKTIIDDSGIERILVAQR